MKYFDVFTGGGGFHLGMPNNFKCVGFSEIDKWCDAVLKYRFPDIKNYGDITKLDTKEVEDFDLLVGGSPCQGLSSAGKRVSLEDPRSNLFYQYIRVLKEKQPKYFLWENVQNTLSINNGKDFEEIKKNFIDAGYSFIWQVIDTSEFGIPLRRDRLFIAGYLGALPEREILPFGKKDPSNSKMDRQLTPLLTATDQRGFSKQRQRIIIADKGRLRYFTPLERERLMGWPDDHTKYGIYNNQVVEMKDAYRIRMTGNGVHSTIVNILINHFFVNI
jgi:DNA (cytosine-5)-methyltransferase 1